MRGRVTESRSRAPGRALALALLGAAVMLSACGSGGAAPPSGARAVVVRGPGGTRLEARELGRGPVAIVLAHGASTTMQSWYAPMDELAAAGFRVLAFNSRGVSDSNGAASTDPAARAQDIEAVVQHLRDTGASRVVVMGSSLGAHAAMQFAGQGDVAAVVGVSPAAMPDGLDTITAPAFFVASEDDHGPAANARALGRYFDRPARIVSGSVHGADLFTDHPEATRSILAFLAEVVPARS